MILKNIGMLLANNVRSTAYLQALIKNNLFPSIIIFLSNEEKASIRDTLPEFIKTKKIDIMVSAMITHTHLCSCRKKN